MRIIIYTIALFTILIGFVPQTSLAQNAPAPEELLNPTPKNPEVLEPQQPIPEPVDPDKKPLPFESYDDIPQEALDDAHDFYEYCKKDLRLPTHYNCECWGSRYLEERIKLGPLASRSSVMMNINKECINIEGAAAYGYKRCQGYGSTTYDGGLDPEEYCECIGNNYALLLQQERGFYMSGKKMNALFTSATLRCRKPPPGMPKIFKRLDIEE